MTGARPAAVVPAGARTGGDDHAGQPVARRARAIVASLAVTQTVGYGALYYAFAVLLTPLARDLHASTTTVTGAFTAAALVGALAAVPVGRWLDRHGGRGLMCVGSLTGTVLLAALSEIDSVTELYVIWIGIGLASAMSLYEAAFAIIVSWHPGPRGRANALLAVTVVAGFASAIFLPLTGALVDRYGWRTAVVILAAVHGVLTVPLHAAVLRRPPRLSANGHPDVGQDIARRDAVRTAMRDRHFWVLTVAFVAHGAAVSVLAVHLISYLIELGHRAVFAATAAGLLGVLSVTGRLVVTGLQRRIRPTTAVAGIFAVQAAAAATLPLTGRSNIGAVIGVIGFGIGFGVATIARPALLAGRYDSAGYATISGVLAVPMTVAKAGAPLAAAALHTAAGGYTTVLVAVAIACLVAAAGVAATPPAADAH